MRFFIPFLLSAAFCTNTVAQVKPGPKDFQHIVAMGKLLPLNPNPEDAGFKKSIDSLRTPALDHVADVMIALNKSDKTLVEARIIQRPSTEELYYWYAIEKVFRNRLDKDKKPEPDSLVAHKALSQKTDERLLLDNFYGIFHSSLASMFNEHDLSETNIDMDNLGLKDKTEKAIFFLNTIHSLVGARFQVLSMMKNDKVLVEFSSKLPHFNNKEYQYYQDFDYKDFKYEVNGEKTTYNNYFIGNLYNTLMAQLNAIAVVTGKPSGKMFFNNSLLSVSKYYKHTPLKDGLEKIAGYMK